MYDNFNFWYFVLGNWMTDLGGHTKIEVDLIVAVVEALAVLSIPDKQVLIETKLLPTLTKWSEEAIEEAVEIKDEVREVEKLINEEASEIAETLGMNIRHA